MKKNRTPTKAITDTTKAILCIAVRIQCSFVCFGVFCRCWFNRVYWTLIFNKFSKRGRSNNKKSMFQDETDVDGVFLLFFVMIFLPMYTRTPSTSSSTLREFFTSLCDRKSFELSSQLQSEADDKEMNFFTMKANDGNEIKAALKCTHIERKLLQNYLLILDDFCLNHPLD